MSPLNWYVALVIFLAIVLWTFILAAPIKRLFSRIRNATETLAVLSRQVEFKALLRGKWVWQSSTSIRPSNAGAADRP